jgi:hypothetical protein
MILRKAEEFQELTNIELGIRPEFGLMESI